MTKFIVLTLFAVVGSAYGMDCNRWNFMCSAPIAMPEPSAIPELAMAAVGLGIYAWRKRKIAR